jgi:hypothetical protein
MNKETQNIEQAENKALHIADVMQCFYFGFSKEYPSGFVSITKENAEKLQKHGWTVSFHTDYYLNTISAEIKQFSIGFASWMDNLTAYIDYGEYQEIIEIKSREQLDKFLQLIESTMQFSNIAQRFGYGQCRLINSKFQ